MNTHKLVNGVSNMLLAFSVFSIAMVGVMAFGNPQSVMDLVKVNLTNNDAYSSIRGVYGGVSFTIVLLLIYFIRKDNTIGLLFISILWGFYALSRVITIYVEGSLGDFGTKWLVIESTLCVLSLTILLIKIRLERKA